MTRQIRYQQGELSPADREILLQADVSAVLAFVDARGFPRQLPCWFLWEAPAFYVTSMADKFHVRRLQANSRASICVEMTTRTAARRSNAQVKGIGEIEVFPDVDDWALKIRRKYLGELAVESFDTDADRVVLRLQPRRLSAHGGVIEYGS